MDVRSIFKGLPWYWLFFAVSYIYNIYTKNKKKEAPMIINKVFKTKEKMYAYYLDQAKQKVIKRRKDLIASYSIVL